MSKWVSYLFLVLFVLFCVVCVCFIGLLIFNQINSDLSKESFPRALTMSLLVIDLIILGGTLFIIRSIFNNISKGNSPFTVKHSQQLMMLGFFFLIDIVLNLLLSPAFSSITNIGPVEFGYIAPQTTPYPVLSIDIKSIVGTVVCFALSVVWRYGALLQSETDDLF